jgi:protein phosphatase
MTDPGLPPRAADRKPRDEEIDVWGMTHQGNVRKSNEDHFLIGSLRHQLAIHSTSIPESQISNLGGERVAFLAMIADGVGGRSGGEEASRLALEEVSLYVSQSTQCFYERSGGGEPMIDLLQRAASSSHERVQKRAAEQGRKGMATTLTLWIGVWPWFYLLQVGDSRYYLFADDTLTQVSRDQTMAQELVDQGVLARSALATSPLSNVLSSSLGGPQTAPMVTRIASEWPYIHLLCSDGLTKHVSDEQIADRLRNIGTSKEACELLIEDALAGGGTDNITVIVGQAKKRD